VEMYVVDDTEKAMGHESRIELWSPLDRGSALLVSELTGFVPSKR